MITKERECKKEIAGGDTEKKREECTRDDCSPIQFLFSLFIIGNVTTIIRAFNIGGLLGT